ncbi:MATE efflux family protein [Oceanicola granulosus HTCC2516]|uniref:Multidrug-efflux transporter n=2 Tax=Oceanicola granulosus (strain ATCC BAA-861 / DSM 15982 / KCTC 12143 / HTCC2516) TaxID=314256 RepID=Q2CIX5_OCEGH|nr:MATE family efflux transporter [Oceanicola granulosus]EAR52464.1 MATE efflux family protein [Oceanicola granulosus HTCC2516]
MSATSTPLRPPGPTSVTGHGRALLVLGMPLVGSNVAQVAISSVDTIMLGWYDVTALAAVTLAVGLWILIFLLAAGFGWAVAPLAAEALERDDTVLVRRTTRMGLWLSVLSAALVYPVFWWSGPLFRAAGQEPEIAQLAQDYLRIHGLTMFPALFVMALRSFLSVLERTRVILWVTVGAAVLNAGLNWVLIFGNLGAPELGIRGAALASLILQLAGFAVLVLYVMRKTPEYALFTRLWKVDGQVLARVFRLGLPMGVTAVAEATLFTVSAVMMGWIGEVPLAAHGIAMQLSSMTFVVHLGLSQAATVRAGRAFGRRDEVALRTGGVAALALSAAMALLTMVLFLAVPGPLVALFVGPDDPMRAEILAFGVVLLAIAALFQVVDAAQVMTIGLLRGVQDTAVPLLIAAVSYWGLGLPAGYLLGFTFGFGGIGVWAGMTIGLGAAAIMLSARFWRGSGRLSPPPAAPRTRP